MRHLHQNRDLAQGIHDILVESLDLKFDFTATNSTSSIGDKDAIHSFIWQDRKLQSIRLGGLIAAYWSVGPAHYAPHLTFRCAELAPAFSFPLLLEERSSSGSARSVRTSRHQDHNACLCGCLFEPLKAAGAA